MAVGTLIAASVMTGAASEGSSSRRAMRRVPLPESRAASTKSRPLRARVWARTIRAVPPQSSSPMTRISSSGRGNPAGTTAVSAMPITSMGRAIITSVKRPMSRLRKRPPSAAASPIATPTKVWTTTAPRATSSEIRAP